METDKSMYKKVFLFSYKLHQSLMMMTSSSPCLLLSVSKPNPSCSYSHAHVHAYAQHAGRRYTTCSTRYPTVERGKEKKKIISTPTEMKPLHVQ